MMGLLLGLPDNDQDCKALVASVLIRGCYCPLQNKSHTVAFSPRLSKNQKALQPVFCLALLFIALGINNRRGGKEKKEKELRRYLL